MSPDFGFPVNCEDPAVCGSSEDLVLVRCQVFGLWEFVEGEG